MGKKRHQTQNGKTSSSNTKTFETVAYVRLNKRTLVNSSFHSELKHFVRFTSFLPPASNNGGRLFIFDHRPQMIETVKGYKNRKSKKRNSMNRFIRNGSEPAKVIVMKKPNGQFYINIFPVGREINVDKELAEGSWESLYGKSIFGGDPFWALIDNDGPSVGFIAVQDIDPTSERRLQITEPEEKQIV